VISESSAQELPIRKTLQFLLLDARLDTSGLSEAVHITSLASRERAATHLFDIDAAHRHRVNPSREGWILQRSRTALESSAAQAMT